MSSIKPPQQLLSGASRLRSTAEGRLLHTYLLQRKQEFLKALTVASLTDVAQLQGRVQELDDLITILERDK